MPEYLENRSNKSVLTNSLCDFASIILKDNSFENEEIKYHKKRGTAVEIKFAPPYSNLPMAGFEKIIFRNSEFKPFLRLLYIADIFFIWTEGSH